MRQIRAQKRNATQHSSSILSEIQFAGTEQNRLAGHEDLVAFHPAVQGTAALRCLIGNDLLPAQLPGPVGYDVAVSGPADRIY